MSKKTDEIISIDLNEKKKEEVKKEIIEIKAGDELYIQISNRKRIREAIEVLKDFEMIEEEPKPIIQTKETPSLADIPKEKLTENLQKSNEVILNKGQRFERCPLCSSKLKRKKIQQFEDGLLQEIVCKNRKCGWRTTYKIAV